MQQRKDAAPFAESGAPPWGLRALLWGAPLAIVAFGWVDGGADGAAGGAVAAAVVLLFATLPLEFSFAWYGGVRVVDGRLHVGRRSVPVQALDLSTLTFEVGPEIYSVFDKHRMMSNPIWLHDKLAVDGRHDGQVVRVVVSTNRRDELVAALRSAHAASDPQG